MSTNLDQARQANADLWRQLHALEDKLQQTEQELLAARLIMQLLGKDKDALEDHLDACATAGCERCKQAIAEIAL